MNSILDKQLTEHIACFQELAELGGRLEKAAGLLTACVQQGGKILICGNGGSAADSQHFAAELVGRFYKNRAALPAVALTTDTSIITAMANDFGYEHIFSRQVEALGQHGDLVLGLSTSGTSENVIQALLAARKKQMPTIAMTGADGGKLSGLVDCLIRVPSRQTPRVQEAHLFLLHVLAERIETTFFNGEATS